jgi:hypothetical protein
MPPEVPDTVPPDTDSEPPPPLDPDPTPTLTAPLSPPPEDAPLDTDTDPLDCANDDPELRHRLPVFVFELGPDDIFKCPLVHKLDLPEAS